MKKDIKKIFFRYLIILIAGLGNLVLFYKFLTPLTVHSVGGILSIFTQTVIKNSTIYLRELEIQIIPSCVAGSAFYLLFILNLTTRKIKANKRIKILLVSFASLFVLNLSRILILIAINKKPYFESVHWVFWNLISIVFIAGIWIAMTKIYKIREIPVYSDVKYLINTRKKSKKRKKHK